MNALLLLAAIAVRNPCWPIGYEGAREAISADPVVDVTAGDVQDETATAAKAATVSKSINGRHWSEARKALRVGGVAMVTNADGSRRHGIVINGLVYGDGDYVSVNVRNRRFTWRVQGLTDGATLKLVRVRARFVDGDGPAVLSKGAAK